MRIILPFLSLLVLVISGCNSNDSKDTVEIADSINKANIDSAINNKTVTVDDASAEFMVKAANGRMSDADLGALAQQKGSSQAVKDFGSMILSDHTTVNDQLKMLATSKNVILPEAPTEERMNIKTELTAKSGKAFDKAYMNRVIKDHEEAINLFEKAVTGAKDPDVTAFADKTLPKLKDHLVEAKKIRDGL